MNYKLFAAPCPDWEASHSSLSLISTSCRLGCLPTTCLFHKTPKTPTLASYLFSCVSRVLLSSVISSDMTSYCVLFFFFFPFYGGCLATSVKVHYRHHLLCWIDSYCVTASCQVCVWGEGALGEGDKVRMERNGNDLRGGGLFTRYHMCIINMISIFHFF